MANRLTHGIVSLNHGVTDVLGFATISLGTVISSEGRGFTLTASTVTGHYYVTLVDKFAEIQYASAVIESSTAGHFAQVTDVDTDNKKVKIQLYVGTTKTDAATARRLQICIRCRNSSVV